MWYLGWILGSVVAVGFTLANGLWLERREDKSPGAKNKAP